MASDTGMTNSNPPPLVQIAVSGLMDTHPVDHLDSSSDHDDNCDEPALKHRRVDVDFDVNSGTSVKQILFNINKAICMRLDCIENYLTTLNTRTREIEDKVDQLMSMTKQSGNGQQQSGAIKKGAIVVGLPQHNGKVGGDGSEGIETNASLNSVDSIASLGPNVTLITLNSEEDFPNGTWLGDESNVEMRVRCAVTPSDLLHIHSNCRTPEKMALTLLDYLFDRETQAVSNLSGLGKHGKKQLDPLMIYGIRCHLIHRFQITENDWHRIKQNIDSKCRTAFRRRQRGMPLTVKAFRGKALSGYNLMPGEMMSDDDSISHEDSLHIHQGNNHDVYLQGDLDSQHGVSMQGDGLQGEVQILHATPEQISQLQHAQHIQILQGDQVIQVPVPHNIQQLNASDLPEGLQVAVSAVSLPQMSDTSPQYAELKSDNSSSHDQNQ
ncbi:protein BANP-like [Mercenaria mercenaria]|uniref:protein BANP-like n=1 Tax=Mercenaria mercenaria TaxID=6596 RepID=UPI001E1D61DC|nr:protein BANP-like [Mercenaria mercenaria]XP_045192507.1 protein BANP-like [Mercenaria mercenaria]